jgi:hypothetical protein
MALVGWKAELFSQAWRQNRSPSVTADLYGQTIARCCEDAIAAQRFAIVVLGILPLRRLEVCHGAAQGLSRRCSWLCHSVDERLVSLQLQPWQSEAVTATLVVYTATFLLPRHRGHELDVGHRCCCLMGALG